MIKDVERKIRQIRELKGFSQEYVANQLNLSTRAYSKIETAETQLTIPRLNQISDILGVSTSDIINFDEKTVFNSVNQQGGEYIAYNNTEIKQVQELYKELLAEKDKRIAMLEKVLGGK